MVDTCPKCGALISPNLPRCRQCGTYLHGTKLEGFIFESLLPKGLAASPGTGIIFLFVILYYLLMGVLAGPVSLIAMTPYNLDQLGSTSPPGIFLGQYWRFFTSMFGHHDLVHIAFNLYALTIAGPLVEELYDRKKMMIIYFVGGAFSMVISYIWHAEWMGYASGGSIGASGAVSALIGATLFGAVRLGPDGRFVKSVMIRWVIYMAAFGLIVAGIDNAAHAGGFLTGAALAYVTPLGNTKSVAAQKLLSVVMLVLVALVIGSTALMIDNLRGFPVSLEKDGYGRQILFFTIEEGTESDYSSQAKLFEDCAARVQRGDVSEEAAYACELATRAVPHAAILYRALAHIVQAQGDEARAKKLVGVALRIERRM